MGVSGIILAGGKSSRMGKDKTLLTFQHETLIERTIRELESLVDEIIIASNDNSKYNIPGIIEIPDIYPGMGPLGGLHAGLLAAKYRYSFVISGDMPLFTKELASYFLERKEGYDVVAAEIRNRWEPLCAVYAKECLPAITSCLQADRRKVQSFYSQVNVRKIQEEELRVIGDLEELFYNLNTPEELNLLLQRNMVMKKQ